MSLRYRQLGPLKVSVLGMGALHFGVYITESEAVALIHRALDLGVNFIDTAPMYGHGHSEEIVGKAVTGRRHQVLLATKVGLAPASSWYGPFRAAVQPLSKQAIRQSLPRSLRALNTDYIDLYQLHAYHQETLEETLGALADLRVEGLVRAVGLSNFSPAELQQAAALWYGFTSYQVQYNLLERRAERTALKTCLDLGVGVICNRALCYGILSGKYRPGQPPPEGSRGALSSKVRGKLKPPVLELAAALHKLAWEMGHTGTDLAIAWLLRQPAVACVLAGMRDIRQLEANARATGWVLSEDDELEINRVTANLGQLSRVLDQPRRFLLP